MRLPAQREGGNGGMQGRATHADTRPCTAPPGECDAAGKTSPTQRLDPRHILGCSREEAIELFNGRPITPGEAEAIAERSYRWRSHLHDPESYWITTVEAARILELTPRQVKGLLDRGQLRHVRHISRVRLMRRAHIVSLAATRH